ncbi:DUF4214 domain-containing protein [Pseudomonas sp. LJDD11]|uniref:DUF4214 domain-containing protein n=1 Tax=Pseudomonas sp. LJDD11 TaxID=2931984 RepID=UPI00211BC051|nr:DUF4214 domain-containing protein [Pseudomonas sp. LJDD11]MCQ9425613.1 DUF4214 domain-containing protein [Pseudomonas sp. LJDD11]
MSTQSDLAELYTTFFDRAPDAGGLAYWVAQIDGGQITLAQVAENWLTQQPEGQSNFPSTLTDAQFIEAVYNNLLGRTADAGGAQYWLQQLQSGAVPRDSFALSLINGAKANTSTQGLQDAALINNKATIGVAFAAKGLNDLSLANAIVQSVTADANTLSATQAILGLIPATTAGQTTAILTAANQLLTKLTALITAAPGEVADANTYLNALLSGATSNTNLVTLFTNANTLLTSAATDSAALDNPATKGAADVVVATPTSGGGGSTPTTFTATVDVNGELSFGGTATGDISVAINGADVTFTRGGVDATSVTFGSITSISGNAPIVLNFAEYGAFSSKLSATTNITVNDNGLTAANIATLGADTNVAFIRAATQVLDKTQYAAASDKLDAADSITVNDNTLTAADIATLGADGNVDSIRAATQILDKTQYAAASAKLNSADSITVVDNSLTAAEVAVLGADAKVDDIGVSPLTLNATQFTAAGAKLRSVDTITISDTGTAITSAITFITAEASVVDVIKASDSTPITLSIDQLTTITAAKFDAADTVVVSDLSANIQANLTALLAEGNVDTIDSSDNLVVNLTVAQAIAAGNTAKFANDDLINVTGLSADIQTNLSALLNDTKVDTIDSTEDNTAIVLSAAQATSANLTKLVAGDTINLVDSGANLQTALATLVGIQPAQLAKIDNINANDDQLTLSAVQAVALGAKLTDANDVITITNSLAQAGQVITNGAVVFQTTNDKLQFSAAELTGAAGFISYSGGNTAVTFSGGAAELVVSTGGTLVASSAQATFLFDTATGTLSFDADGTDTANAAIPVLTLTGVSLLADGDFAFVA